MTTKDSLLEQLKLSASEFDKLLSQLGIDDAEWYEGSVLDSILEATTAQPSAAPDQVESQGSDQVQNGGAGISDVTGMVVNRGIHAVQNDGLAILNSVDRMFELSGDQLEKAVADHVLEGRNYLVQRALMGFGRGSQSAQQSIRIEELPVPKFNSQSRLSLPSAEDLNNELNLLPASE